MESAALVELNIPFVNLFGLYGLGFGYWQCCCRSICNGEHWEYIVRSGGITWWD